MRVKITLKSIDLLEGEENIVADGIAILNENSLKYAEGGEEKAMHFVTFEDNCVRLERKAEISSITVLNLGKRGYTTVHSPYGDMNMITNTSHISRENDSWTVEYSVFSEHEKVLHQKLIWNIQYLN